MADIKKLKDAVKKAETQLDDAERDHKIAEKNAQKAWDEHFQWVAKAMAGVAGAAAKATAAQTVAQAADQKEAAADAALKKAKAKYAKAQVELTAAEISEAFEKAFDKIKKIF